jgi:hypothetical protein
MGDILKEAIADAKAVRETALENAKMALEEAFTPQIKSMLSAKLKEDDMDDEAEEDMHDEGEHDDEAEEGEHEEGMREDDEEAEEGEREEGMHDDEAEEGEREEGMHDEGEHDDAEEGMHDEDEEMDESNLDLEAIIKELESELTEDDDEDEAEEGEDMRESEETVEEEYEIDEAALTEEDDEDDKDEVDEELDKSSGIGKGDNKEDNTDVSSGIGGGKKGMTEIQAELKEYKEAVHFLKDKLHEVNILNAKLLFTNKLFKAYSLDNNQKLKVVETFDRAQTTREIKLVYSTLAEQFGDNGSIVTKKSISESASAPVASTKPSKESRKVISEETQVANRFKKLAGLIK